jgi:HAMP domain-containing protein
VIAVAGLVWAIFSIVVAACAAVLVRMTFGLLRAVRTLKQTTDRFAQDLNEAMGSVTGGLERAEQSLGRIRERGLRK